MNNKEWSQLRPLSKLDQLAETIIKTAFILSDNHHVIQSYLNHKGAHFKVQNRVGEKEIEILCRQINIEKTNYAFISKKDLERGLRDDLWIGVVLFMDGKTQLSICSHQPYGMNQISYLQILRLETLSMVSV